MIWHIYETFVAILFNIS